MSGSKMTEEDKALVQKIFGLLDEGDTGEISKESAAVMLDSFGFQTNRLALPEGRLGLARILEIISGATSNASEQKDLVHAFRLFSDQPLPSRSISVPRLQTALASLRLASAREISKLVEQLELDTARLLNYHRLVQQYVYEQ
ncbi:hypothetical protein WJX84_008148 [Apatococcus fuscideae]|uniref:EF-hand domain-containing protein n=1 Tax=Apatococcus fuscideae TaxID=2026836 RepID=A0AAW1TG80_9CHLO